MSKLRFVILFFFLPLSELVAQVPFLQPGQTPMLLNPALAGSKRSDRVAVAYQHQGNPQEKISRIYGSYDKLIPKIGSGVGIWFSHSTERDVLITEEFRSNNFTGPKNHPYEINYYRNEIGLSIAPKYNITGRNRPNEIVFSLSPALFVAYERGQMNNNQFFSNSVKYFYNDIYPDGQVLLTDSAQYVHSSVTSDRLKSGISLMVNSKTFVVHYKTLYLVSLGKETNQFLLTEKGVGILASSPMEIRKDEHTFYHTLFAGKTFPERPESRYSITPMAGIGLRHRVFPGKGDVRSAYYYLSYRPEPRVNYIHASLTGRFGLMLIGGGYNKYETYKYGFGSLGVQHKKFKVTSSLGYGKANIGHYLMKETAWLTEISGNYFF